MSGEWPELGDMLRAQLAAKRARPRLAAVNEAMNVYIRGAAGRDVDEDEQPRDERGRFVSDDEPDRAA